MNGPFWGSLLPFGVENLFFSSASAAAVALPLPRPAARSRAFSRRAWWPRVQDPSPIPGWVHALLLAVLLLFDGFMYYFQGLSPKIGIKLDFSWFVRNGLLDVLTVVLFYWNWLVLIPRILAHNRVAWYVVGVLLSVAVLSCLRLGVSELVNQQLAHATTHLGRNLREVFVTAVALSVPAFGIVLFSSGLRITLDYLQGQRNHRERERQHLLTELAMLKAQINPHFLFNTLNNIYSLTSRKSDRAPEAVLRLAESMRYLLYESTADAVPLGQELAHLRSFLDLQRLRLPAAEAQAAIVLDAHGAIDGAFAVAPLLLLPLVENAFKHGDLAARPEAIRIELEVAEHELRFSVHNYVAPAAELPAQPGGLGLHNLRRRLELLYPGQHTLDVRTLPGEYAVELVLTNRAQ